MNFALQSDFRWFLALPPIGWFVALGLYVRAAQEECSDVGAATVRQAGRGRTKHLPSEHSTLRTTT
ncbi:hypothetical protein PHO31112_02235 [Pandoraea horticolens]|uniref:Uncharacterized protein n=1 Tax=Pandoraea horticolens TaxID=2508298 RepID=A0A5E4UST2_9BURK|nr:hypothetical protein PHO31112_02235 [Pandoraea horticolens]